VSGSRARILAVEDTPHNLELMTYLLEAHGHSVVPATTAAEALEQARANRPDLIILDVQLPDADGYEVLARVRADKDLRDIPAVAVTAYAMLGDRDQALAAGFDGYLTKPIEPTTFALSIDLYLPIELRGASPAGRTARPPERY
jgi:CheY-like chemotaxis protein